MSLLLAVALSTTARSVSMSSVMASSASSAAPAL
jgi:hypothetical protein